MQKKFWVKIIPFEKNLLTAAIEAGAGAIFVENENVETAKKLAKIEILSPKDFGKKLEIVKIAEKSDEKKVENLRGKIPCVVQNADWTIIPLENLISKTTNLIQSVENSTEAKLALETMERGADGIFLETDSANEIKKTGAIFEQFLTPKLNLQTAKILQTKPVAMSDRCCVDTTSILPAGSGLLVGDSSSAFFLVHNENVSAEYCAARPFRVNAGAVHAYVFLPENRTKYLCELSAGDEVLISNFRGETQKVAVGRNKIERRPMLLVEAAAENKKISLVLQNAETIRLVAPDGAPRSVVNLKAGDEVLVFLEKSGGRHFGEKIEETIREN